METSHQKEIVDFLEWTNRVGYRPTQPGLERVNANDVYTILSGGSRDLLLFLSRRVKTRAELDIIQRNIALARRRAAAATASSESADTSSIGTLESKIRMARRRLADKCYGLLKTAADDAMRESDDAQKQVLCYTLDERNEEVRELCARASTVSASVQEGLNKFRGENVATGSDRDAFEQVEALKKMLEDALEGRKSSEARVPSGTDTSTLKNLILSSAVSDYETPLPLQDGLQNSKPDKIEMLLQNARFKHVEEWGTNRKMRKDIKLLEEKERQLVVEISKHCGVADCFKGATVETYDDALGEAITQSTTFGDIVLNAHTDGLKVACSNMLTLHTGLKAGAQTLEKDDKTEIMAELDRVRKDESYLLSKVAKHKAKCNEYIDMLKVRPEAEKRKNEWNKMTTRMSNDALVLKSALNELLDYYRDTQEDTNYTKESTSPEQRQAENTAAISPSKLNPIEEQIKSPQVEIEEKEQETKILLGKESSQQNIAQKVSISNQLEKMKTTPAKAALYLVAIGCNKNNCAQMIYSKYSNCTRFARGITGTSFREAQMQLASQVLRNMLLGELRIEPQPSNETISAINEIARRMQIRPLYVSELKILSAHQESMMKDQRKILSEFGKYVNNRNMITSITNLTLGMKKGIERGYHTLMKLGIQHSSDEYLEIYERYGFSTPKKIEIQVVEKGGLLNTVSIHRYPEVCRDILMKLDESIKELRIAREIEAFRISQKRLHSDFLELKQHSDKWLNLVKTHTGINAAIKTITLAKNSATQSKELDNVRTIELDKLLSLADTCMRARARPSST